MPVRFGSELAQQIHEQFRALGACVQLESTVILGGLGPRLFLLTFFALIFPLALARADMIQQQIALAKRPHVVVATPGRIVDHLENTKGFSLNHLRFLVRSPIDRNQLKR